MAERGEIDIGEAFRILGIENTGNLTQLQMVQMGKASVSEAGKTLQVWSKIANLMRRRFKDNKEVLEALGDIAEDSTTFTRFMDSYRHVDNIRRALMVSQPVTAIRNGLTQGGRTAIAIFEDAMTSTLGVMRGKITPQVGIDLVGERLMSVMRAFTKQGRAEVGAVLDKFPIQKHKLFRTPIADVNIDEKVAAFVNTLNTMQEHYFRTSAFDAHLRQTARLAGTTIDKLKSRQIEASVKHALEMTFSANPTSKLGKSILGMYEGFPMLTALGTPFPRFWLNAVKAAWEFSPMPLLAPGTYARMASKDPRIAFGALSKASVGTMMWGTGYAADQMGITGEKWHDVRIGDKLFDIRPFSPFVAPFFMGRLMSRVQNLGEDAFMQISLEDWSNAFLSMRRTDAAGIPLLDLLFNTRNFERFTDRTMDLIGNWAAGFTVPLRTVEDIIGGTQALLPPGTPGASQEALLPRSRRENPLIDATIANLPFVARTLPVAPPPLRREQDLRSNPLLKQLTSITFRREHPVETEAARLGLRPQNIYPRTGIKQFDRLITKHMGGIAETMLTSVMSSDFYKQSNMRVQREFFIKFLEIARRTGKGIASGDKANRGPDLMLEEMQKNSSELIKDFIENRFKEPKIAPAVDDENR